MLRVQSTFESSMFSQPSSNQGPFNVCVLPDCGKVILNFVL